MAALGGTAFLPAARAAALCEAAEAVASRRSKGPDPSTVVLLSDIHICGELKDGRSVHYPNNPVCLAQRVKEILAMRPLPANVVVFGDVAWDYGLEDDYRYAAELLKPLADAGIGITLGMGNHDRRASFFSVFPDYRHTTKVAGRVVSVVELPFVDLVLLDSLAEKPGLAPRQSTTVSGEIDDAQLEWLKGFVADSAKPVIIGAHHPLGELPQVVELITGSHNVAGYINGHNHVWDKKVRIMRPRNPERMLPIVELPSTFYGDIGFAVMHVDAEGVRIDFSSKGFWWPEPVQDPPAQWRCRQDDLAGESCSFTFQ